MIAIAIAMSLVLVISTLPAMAFASETTAAGQSLEQYTGLQQGTTSTRIYMLNCGELETTFPAVFGDNNEYGSRWEIKTNTNETAFFDNYILDKPDSREELEFVFSIGGSGMNHLTDDEGTNISSGSEIPEGTFKTGVADYVNIVDSAGENQPRTISMIFTPHPGSGGGTGGGPSRAVDVIVKVAAGTLETNATYKLALTSGRSALDKDIYFTFTTAPILAEQITLSDSAAKLVVGETKTLTATVLPENTTNKDGAWTSSDETVATVDDEGLITAVNPGKAAITATTKDGSEISAACQVTVDPILIKSIALNADSLTLKEGQTSTLKTTVLPENATNKALAWSSSDTQVATVDADGSVKGRKAGCATITATAKDESGAAASCEVTVEAAATENITETVNNTTTNGSGKESFNAAATNQANAAPRFSRLSIKAAAKGHESVKVSWSEDKAADGYRIYRQTGKSKKFKALADTKKRTFIDKDLVTGQRYAYKARAYKAIDGKKVFGSYSAKAAAAPVPAAMEPKLKARKGKIAISWKPVAGATKYIVYKSTKKNSGYYKARITTKTAFIDTHVKKGKTYYYKARSYKAVKGKKIYGQYTKAFQVKVK